MIDRRSCSDEFLWWLRLALTAIPVILVLLLWARVGWGYNQYGHSGDESEEQRRQREARETGEAFGSLAGLAVGAAIYLAKQSDEDAQEGNEVLDEEEDHAFDLTM